MDKVLNKIISVLLVLVPTFIFGFMSRPAEMLISLIAGFTSVVLLNMDKFESFKAGQLEATLREAKEIIDDANATIAQLTSVTTPLLKSNLSFLLYEGTFDGMPVDEQEKTFNELLKIKDSLNLTDIDQYFIDAAKGISSHYFSNIFREVAEIHDGFRIKYGQYTTIDYAPETPTVSDLEAFFEEYPELQTDNVKENLEKFKEIKLDYIEK